ncbi:uncharacterized protein LOC141611558 [Silene latifolia]|uniref:uncharacterized protein LOC141611558 n=1 Tax=Silene latifolia TaxID=37657 RepID=UPI003D76B5F9
MKNPLRFFCKSRGLSDSTVHHGGDHQSYNQQQPHAPSFPPPPTSQSLVPVGYPTGTGGYGYNNYPPVVQPPTAYPYAAQEEEKEEEAAWEFNAGNNVNKKGQQKAGHIKVGNSVNGAGLPINLPKNGRFVFNAGGNTNDGDMQEGGHIEFGNAQLN